MYHNIMIGPVNGGINFGFTAISIPKSIDIFFLWQLKKTQVRMIYYMSTKLNELLTQD